MLRSRSLALSDCCGGRRKRGDDGESDKSPLVASDHGSSFAHVAAESSALGTVLATGLDMNDEEGYVVFGSSSH